jgi:hypothetical protein
MHPDGPVFKEEEISKVNQPKLICTLVDPYQNRGEGSAEFTIYAW